MRHLNNFQEHNEGIKIASRAWKGGQGAHYDYSPNKGGRNQQLKKDALLHLFRDFVGKQMGFKMNTGGSTQKIPLEYVLTEVTGVDKKGYSGSEVDNLQTFDFDFWAEDGVKNDAPFADNKKEVVLQYSIKNDEFTLKTVRMQDVQAGGQLAPQMNRKLAKFLVNAANKLREMVTNVNMPQKEIGTTYGDKFYKKVNPSEEGWKEYDQVKRRSHNTDYEPDTERAEELKKSKLKWSDFRCFDDSEGKLQIK